MVDSGPQQVLIEQKPKVEEVRPFVKPEGKFGYPYLCATLTEASEYKRKHGGLIFKYYDGRYVVVYPKEIK